MHLIYKQLNLMIRGRFDEAWKLAEELEALDPNESKAKFNRGWFLINQGKLQEGFQCLEHGRGLNVYGGGKINTTKPIWDQSDLKGKTVILNMECGFGDQMIYARFATEIWKRGGTCIMCCDKSLHTGFDTPPLIFFIVLLLHLLLFLKLLVCLLFVAIIYFIYYILLE